MNKPKNEESKEEVIAALQNAINDIDEVERQVNELRRLQGLPPYPPGELPVGKQ